MSSPWRSLLTAALLGAAPAEAQQVRELGVQAIATASDPALVTAGGYVGWRTSRRMRVSVAAGIGVADGDAAWRGEALLHFLFTSRARRGVGGYAAGGVAVVGGPVDEGYLVLTAGLEARPGSTGGWFLEAGVGGGARVALGFRRRWLGGWGR